MRSRAGFTLIEILIVMAILLILAGIIYPKFVGIKMDAEGRTMAATARHIRNQIQLHASIADVPLSFEGYPTEVDPKWFPRRRLPRDPWTYTQLKIQVVAGPKDATEPNNKTFKIKRDGSFTGHTAWYNKSNGSFCIKIPDKGSEAHIQAMFQLVNRYSGGFHGNGNGGKGKGSGNGNKA